MKILLIDADSKIPNLALMKLSTFHKNKGDIVLFKKLNISYYPNKKNIIHYIDNDLFNVYDKIYCSVIFPNSIKYIKGENIIFGGTGYDLKIKLPDEIENIDPDYTLYPENNISYGFISRGCIRNCSFCFVPKKEGMIKFVCDTEKIIKHKQVEFLDNNILALPEHKKILKKLVDLKVKCCFKQGLDIRLIDTENSLLLSKLKYISNYIFAFDDIKYKYIIERKLKLLSWRKDWQLKFYIYVNPNMPIQDTIKRVKWCKKNKVLPYIMRDISCWEDKNKNFYNDICSWCNQVNIIKKVDFKNFLYKRHKNINRINESLYIYENAI